MAFQWRVLEVLAVNQDQVHRNAPVEAGKDLVPLLKIFLHGTDLRLAGEGPHHGQSPQVESKQFVRALGLASLPLSSEIQRETKERTKREQNRQCSQRSANEGARFATILPF